MYLINMKRGERVSSSSSKHSHVLERYKVESGYREATALEYEIAGLLLFNDPDAIRDTLNCLVKEMAR